MTQTVNVPGVGTLNFPDGMSQADMGAAIRKNFPQVAAKAKAAPPRESALRSVVGMAARPILKTAAGIADLPGDAIAEGVNLAAHRNLIEEPGKWAESEIDKHFPPPASTKGKVAEFGSEMLLGAAVPGGEANAAAEKAADTARAASHAIAYVEKQLGLRWQQLSPELKQAMVTVARNPKDLVKLDPAKVAQEVRGSTPKGQLTQNLQKDLDILRSKFTSNEQTRQGVGGAVQGTLRHQLKKVRGKVSQLYNVAKTRGEGETSVDVSPLVAWMKNPANARNAPWLRAALLHYSNPKAVYSEEAPDAAVRSLNTRVDVPKVDTGVTDTQPTIARHISVNDMEKVRQEANAHGFGRGSDVAGHYAKEAKKVIDSILDRSGGPVYKAARAAHAAYKEEWTRQSIIHRLSSDKFQSSDPRVAMERTAQTVIRASAADVAKVRDTLTSGGKRGVAAWQRLQAGSVGYLKEVATKSADRFLDHLQDLDRDGKLSVLFGPDAAQQMRALAQTIRPSEAEPEGAKKSVSRIVRLAEYAARWLPTAGYITGHWPGLVAGHAAEATVKHLIGRGKGALGPVERAAQRTIPALRRAGEDIGRRLKRTATATAASTSGDQE